MPTAGIPESVPPENERPDGRSPTSAMTGARLPVAVGVKAPAVPITDVAVVGEVKGWAWSTISVTD